MKISGTLDLLNLIKSPYNRSFCSVRLFDHINPLWHTIFGVTIIQNLIIMKQH